MFGLKLYLHKGIPEIISVLRIRRSRGIMRRVIRRCARVFEFCSEVMWVGSLPRWVISSMNRVYEAVSRVAAPVRIMVRADQLNRAIMMVNSAIRFVVGGRAMFVRLASSHQVAVSGRRGCKPRVRRRIRLWVRS